jgi:L-seryl-tRNA(Ser) seleniumtransferase
MLEEDRGRGLVARHGRKVVLFAIQRALQDERMTASVAEPQVRWERIEASIRELKESGLRPVINATGVVLHTNLGRAPLPASAADAAAQIAGRYSNLELDLQTGRRGSRHIHAEKLLCQLSGAEAAGVVNNGAAAILLMLSALARGKEVLVSRGELVEIGGAFRMPDIMRLSGARLVEVGTTNRTRLQDYRDAITPRTAAILKVHASNFQVVGFTESADLESLAGLAAERDVLLLHDLGSGAFLETSQYGLASEPLVQSSISAGVDCLTCSGDKLLGGPQAGLILGRRELVGRVLKHPLARAVRVDKMTLAALWAILDIYIAGREPELPIYRMVSLSEAEIKSRAGGWVRELAARGMKAEMLPGASTIGGGSLPGETLSTCLVALRGRGGAARLLDLLRRQQPPVIARIQDGMVMLDPRTVLPDEDAALLGSVGAALKGMT